MAKLILIRHGETDYNLENRYCGFSDPPLNNKGIWQAKKLAVRLKDVNIDKVYSSDLKRAYETAEIIFNPSTTLMVNGERSRTIKNNLIEKLADFREINFGIFEGLRYEEIIKRYPEIYRRWVDNPQKTNIPNAETLSELSERVKEKLSSILSEHKGKTIAIVTHAGPIKIILCAALKYGFENFWKVGREIGGLNIIDYPYGSPAIVITMNDTAHLSEEEVSIL